MCDGNTRTDANAIPVSSPHASPHNTVSDTSPNQAYSPITGAVAAPCLPPRAGVGSTGPLAPPMSTRTTSGVPHFHRGVDMVEGRSTIIRGVLKPLPRAVYTAESKTIPGAEVRLVNHVMIDFSSPESGHLCTVVVAACPDADTSQRFFVDSSAPSDGQNSCGDDPQEIRAAFRISYHPTSGRNHPLSRYHLGDPTLHPVPTTAPLSSRLDPLETDAGDPVARWALPFTDDQIGVAANVCHDMLQSWDLSRPFSETLRYLKAQRAPSSVSFSDRVDVLHAVLSQILRGTPAGIRVRRADLLTAAMSEAIRKTAHGQRRPAEWEQ